MRGILLLALAALTACSTRTARIKQHQAAFDAAPAEVQREIRAGQVDVGFTEEQVLMAVGKPDRVYSASTSRAAQTIWVYGVGVQPAVGFGVGLGGGVSTVYGGGVQYDMGGDSDYTLRVVFENGQAVKVERRQK